MEFRVLAEAGQGMQGQAGPAGADVVGFAHLAVDGADQTLCAEAVTLFQPVDGLTARDDHVTWCWLCRATALT